MKNQIHHFAVDSLGFDDCGITDVDVSGHLPAYRAWLKRNSRTDMTYLKRHLPFKENPGLLLKDARSAVVVIKNYNNTAEKSLRPPFKIARYAVGKDYHSVIGEKLKKLSRFIEAQMPGAKCFTGVDSAPIAERSLALKSGIGFLGKNSMVIQPGLGSYFFIGVLLTDAKLPADRPLAKDCGSCRLCVDACPTGAIEPGSTVNAARCISYRTIEKKSPLSARQLKETGGWLFGCDICQEVCPYNHGKLPLTDWKEFLPASGVGFDFLSQAQFPKIPKDSPLFRSRKRLVPNWLNALEMFSPPGPEA